MTNELPLITNAADITAENCPGMYEELCNGRGDESEDENE